MRVWITRAQPEAEATAARVRDLGWDPLVAPLLDLSPVEGRLSLDGVGALAFTSRNGVRFFAARSTRRDFPVFAVGAATAEAARSAGFERVLSADADVEALADVIAGERPTGAVLHASPAEPAGELVESLQRKGVSARRAVLYEAVARQPSPEATEHWPALAAVLVHSPRAAQALAAAGPPPPGPPILCMSPSAAAPLLERYADVRAAAEPAEAALLALLGKRRAAG